MSTSVADIINMNFTIVSNYTSTENDTIYSIAEAYNLTVCEFARANRLIGDPVDINNGSTFLIPLSTSETYDDTLDCLMTNTTAQLETTATCINGGPHAYTTVKGDTLQKIAELRYNITWESVSTYTAQTAVAAGVGPFEELEVGQTVKIPLCIPSQCTLQPFELTYGTVWDLVQYKTNSSLGQIMSLNPGYTYSEVPSGEGPELTIVTDCHATDSE